MIGVRLTLVLCLAGCASTAAPEPAYYLLRADMHGELAPADPDAQSGIGRVSIAPYLDRAGIVVQVEAHQVREARYHLWAEPLDRGIRRCLAGGVSRRLGRATNAGPRSEDAWRHRVDVAVEEFHGTLDGRARMLARWSIRDLSTDTVVASGRFSQTLPQAGDGYAALVDAQLALLDGLAERIAQALRELESSAG